MAAPRPTRRTWDACSLNTRLTSKATRLGTGNRRPMSPASSPSMNLAPCLRQEALRRGMAKVGKVVLLIDGANGLENMGKKCFKDALQIVDFYHALEHG